MRPYYNYEDPQGQGASFSFGASRWTPTVKVLVLLNVAVFIALGIVNASSGRAALWDAWVWAGFYLPNFLRGAFWQPVSYMFVHADIWHLLGNMVGLYFFAGDVERRLGRLSFLVMYFLCGIAGAALSLIQPGTLVIGASGGVLGILVAFALLYPDARVFLFPLPITVRARTLAIIFGFLTLAGLLYSAESGVAHWAHVGGMVVGVLYVKLIPAAQWAGRRLAGFRIPRPRLHEEGRSPGEQAEMDRILEKVHREGITALTNQERDFLTRMSKKLKRGA
jgi:membrane associated rhomboid family serine protease